MKPITNERLSRPLLVLLLSLMLGGCGIFLATPVAPDPGLEAQVAGLAAVQEVLAAQLATQIEQSAQQVTEVAGLRELSLYQATQIGALARSDPDAFATRPVPTRTPFPRLDSSTVLASTYLQAVLAGDTEGALALVGAHAGCTERDLEATVLAHVGRFRDGQVRNLTIEAEPPVADLEPLLMRFEFLSPGRGGYSPVVLRLITIPGDVGMARMICELTEPAP